MRCFFCAASFFIRIFSGAFLSAFFRRPPFCGACTVLMPARGTFPVQPLFGVCSAPRHAGRFYPARGISVRHSPLHRLSVCTAGSAAKSRQTKKQHQSISPDAALFHFCRLPFGRTGFSELSDQFRIASSVSGSNRCSFLVLIATLTSVPFFALLPGFTRAVIL